MPEAPNILLVMTDQQRWDTLRCYGYEHMITPNVDALAARGVAFSRAFVQGAVCGPSRNSIVSSQYVHTHGVYGNEQWLRPDQPNWIEALREGGYHTVNIGKMHTAPIRLAAGFNHRCREQELSPGHREWHADPPRPRRVAPWAECDGRRPICCGCRWALVAPGHRSARSTRGEAVPLPVSAGRPAAARTARDADPKATIPDVASQPAS